MTITKSARYRSFKGMALKIYYSNRQEKPRALRRHLGVFMPKIRYMTVQQLAHASATVAIDGSTTRGRLKTVAALKQKLPAKTRITAGSKYTGE